MSDTQEEGAAALDVGESESVLMSMISQARRKRGAIKGVLTRHMNTIDTLTSDSKNAVQVKEKLSVLTETMESLEDAQAELLSLLSDEEQLCELGYTADILSRAINLKEGINNWLAQYEDDETQEEPREALGNVLEACTSLHHLQVENATLEAELQELTKRRQQQQLELRNVRLKKEKQKLIEEEKKLEEELNSYKGVIHVPDTDGQGHPRAIRRQQQCPATSGVPQPQSTPKGVQKAPMRVSWEPSRVFEESSTPDEPTKTASVLADTLKYVLDTSRDQQRAIVQSLHVPRGEPQTFDGDELEYWPFIRSFKDSIDCLSLSSAQKLVYLKQYCRGKAAQALKSTSYLNPDEGYKAALEILEERFGNPYNITCKWVKKVVNRPEVKTAADLRDYADEIICCVESLKAMNSLSWLGNGDMLAIVENLPYYLKTRWIKANHEIRTKYKRGVEITDLVKFIGDAAEEASDPVFGSLVNKGQKDKGKNYQNKYQKRQVGSFTAKTSITEDKLPGVTGNKRQTAGKCPCCGEGHYLTRCTQFKAMSIKDRREFVMTKGLCLNCFAYGHLVKNCSRNYVCAVTGCGLKHNTYLHFPNQKTDEGTLPPLRVPTETPIVTATPPENTSENSRVSNYASCRGEKLALPIVPARVRCIDTNAIIDTYAMLDPGTNATYCTEELCHKLGATGVTRRMELTTIAQTRMPVESNVITLFVSDIYDNQEPYCISEVTVRPTLNIDLSGLSTHVELQKWQHLNHLELPELDVDQVHLLIGQDCADLLMPGEVKKGRPGEPFAVHTPLGWVINGPIDPFKSTVKTSHFVHNISVLERDLSKLWELEGVNSEVPGMSQSDLKTLETWDNGKIVVENHYTLPIPFKIEGHYLPDNRSMAERRLQMLGKRLNKDYHLRKKYTEEIHKLHKKGYAEEVPPEDLNRVDGKVWYLPHHPVHNPKKPDKTRIVFDCAAKFGGSSLNDHVCQGPDLANKLIGVLLRFRKGDIAFMADIEAMFHQIKVTPDDRDVLRFLWFKDDDTGKSLSTYRMTSHLFGGVWSPSCANYALQQVTKDFQETYPEIVLNTILYNFYVDDCLKAVSNIGIAIPLVHQLTQLLSLRGFHLTKFVSNSPELMNSIPKEEWGGSFTTLNTNVDVLPAERALGMLWHMTSDRLGIDVQIRNNPRTKRGILATLSTVYDPLGLVSPFVLSARRLFQQLCREEKGWDESLPRQMGEQWGRWLNDLPLIKKFSIPRCAIPNEVLVKTLQLHYFCDASEYGYGAVAYLRTNNVDDTVSVDIVMAKSRLSPLKGSTIPRLELAGALEAVRLDKLLQEELHIPLEESIFWTDSTIVLWYLQSPAKRFQTYVANRVGKILDHTNPSQWRYVTTTQNTGDIASRGMTADELLTEDRWCGGPAFLYMERSNWPKQPPFNCVELEEMAEVKKSPLVYSVRIDDDHLGKFWNYYSTWHRMKRAVVWLLRIRQMLRKQPYLKGPMSPREMRTAEEAIIRNAQAVFLQDKVTGLEKLSPQKSASGLLLVGGRLANSTQENYTKHQLILPYEHPAAKLIIEDLHAKLGHAGVERVLAESRRRYWILKGRKLVKKTVHQCITCRKLRGKTEVQQMADLPASRVIPYEPPFTRVGIDYFGPFMVKRARSKIKRYGCIFTCLSTRAVHIEVSHTLDTDSFINALERFIARRGEPKEIWSDNGTNFVGAQRELHRSIKDWNQNQIHEHLLKREITWNFNPPEASHMGGVWERQIRTVRAVLAGVIKQQILDDESLVTLMTIVEGIINGRPITKLSDDPRDERPLTPNHILMLGSGQTLPAGKFDGGDMYRRRWKQVQYLADIFWYRWLREYLPSLQERQKWLTPKRNVIKGDLVLIKQENSPRNHWPLGLVTETYPSPDGLVRSVTVRTAKGTYKRPITKICVLEGTMQMSN